eukprot:Rhum_TRINITY_DN16540_c0_g1::Rhum_TRINITY_DN16540_c0_g1_i1::g.163489::m.163489
MSEELLLFPFSLPLPPPFPSPSPTTTTPALLHACDQKKGSQAEEQVVSQRQRLRGSRGLRSARRRERRVPIDDARLARCVGCELDPPHVLARPVLVVGVEALADGVQVRQARRQHVVALLHRHGAGGQVGLPRRHILRPRDRAVPDLHRRGVLHRVVHAGPRHHRLQHQLRRRVLPREVLHTHAELHLGRRQRAVHARHVRGRRGHEKREHDAQTAAEGACRLEPVHLRPVLPAQRRDGDGRPAVGVPGQLHVRRRGACVVVGVHLHKPHEAHAQRRLHLLHLRRLRCRRRRRRRGRRQRRCPRLFPVVVQPHVREAVGRELEVVAVAEVGARVACGHQGPNGHLAHRLGRRDRHVARAVAGGARVDGAEGGVPHDVRRLRQRVHGVVHGARTLPVDGLRVERSRDARRRKPRNQLARYDADGRQVCRGRPLPLEQPRPHPHTSLCRLLDSVVHARRREPQHKRQLRSLVRPRVVLHADPELNVAGVQHAPGGASPPVVQVLEVRRGVHVPRHAEPVRVGARGREVVQHCPVGVRRHVLLHGAPVAGRARHVRVRRLRRHGAGGVARVQLHQAH